MNCTGSLSAFTDNGSTVVHTCVFGVVPVATAVLQNMLKTLLTGKLPTKHRRSTSTSSVIRSRLVASPTTSRESRTADGGTSQSEKYSNSKNIPDDNLSVPRCQGCYKGFVVQICSLGIRGIVSQAQQHTSIIPRILFAAREAKRT